MPAPKIFSNNFSFLPKKHINRVLEGQSRTGAWQLLDSREHVIFKSRFETKQFNSDAYRGMRVRLRFQHMADEENMRCSTPLCMQLADVAFSSSPIVEAEE